MIYKHILGDIRRMNQKQKSGQINKKLQNFMYEMMQDTHPIAAKKSLELMVTLYRKNVWHDNKTVNVITTALFSPVAKVKVCALKFFLGADDDEDDDSDEEQE